jgi:hypothetical protein
MRERAAGAIDARIAVLEKRMENYACADIHPDAGIVSSWGSLAADIRALSLEESK